MRKGWKIFWIIFLIVLGIGIFFCILGGLLGASSEEVSAALGRSVVIRNGEVNIADNDWEYEYGEKATDPDTREAYQEVEELDVEVCGVLLQVMESEDQDIHVETKGLASGFKYRCKQEGSTLKISTTDNVHVLNALGDNAVIWVYLPKQHLKEVDISNKAGAVYVDSVSAGSLTIDVGAGEGVVNDFSSQEAEFICGAGELTASGDASNKIEVDCGVGEINLTILGKEEDYDYEVDCGVGEVVIGDQSFAGIGSDHHESHHGSRELIIECGVGSVEVSFAG